MREIVASTGNAYSLGIMQIPRRARARVFRDLRKKGHRKWKRRAAEEAAGRGCKERVRERE